MNDARIELSPEQPIMCSRRRYFQKIFRNLILIILLFPFLLERTSYSLAADKNHILGSAQSIVSTWQYQLSKGLYLLHKSELGGDWSIWKYDLIGNIEYDVKTTDSLLNPYVLTINFSARVTDNSVSLQGNASAKAALQRISRDDFSGDRRWDFFVNYGLKDGVWTIINRNRYFGLLMRNYDFKENQRFFSMVNNVQVN